MTTNDCPVKQDTLQIQKLGDDMVMALRKLRKDLRRCKKCEKEADCEIRRDVAQIIHTAIHEVTEEWGLT